MNQAVATWAVRVAAVVVGLAGAAAVVFGLTLVAEDLSMQGELFDGLGTFIGLVVCVLGVLVAGAGWVAVTSVGAMVSAPMVLGGVFIGGLVFGAALGAPRVRVDSPGGNSW